MPSLTQYMIQVGETMDASKSRIVSGEAAKTTIAIHLPNARLRSFRFRQEARHLRNDMILTEMSSLACAEAADLLAHLTRSQRLLCILEESRVAGLKNSDPPPISKEKARRLRVRALPSKSLLRFFLGGGSPGNHGRRLWAASHWLIWFVHSYIHYLFDRA